MNPLLKALVAALVGASAPQAVNALHLSPDVLTAVQAICGAVVAVAYLFADKPKPSPNPTTKDEPPPTDPGGN